MQSIVTSTSRTTKATQAEVSKLQMTSGSNSNGYAKSSYTTTIPKKFIKLIGLQKADTLVWSITETDPHTLTLRKLMIEGDNA